MKKLLVVVDMQNDFLTGSLGSADSRAVIPAVRALAEGAENVVYTQDTHFENYMETREGKNLPVPHCIRGTEGWRISPEVYIEGAPIIEKRTFGSYELVEYVKRGGYDEITFCGILTDICVVSNVMLVKAALPEAEVRVVSHACAGVTPESHEAALVTMKSCQVTVLP